MGVAVLNTASGDLILYRYHFRLLMLEPLRTLFCFLCSNTPTYTLPLARWKKKNLSELVMSSPSQHASHFFTLCVSFISTCAFISVLVLSPPHYRFVLT